MSPQRVGSILLNADELVAELVASKIPHMQGRSFGACVALGVIKDDYLIGGVVYHGYYGFDVQVSIACDRVAFMPWRALFDYPFNQLGCRRITAMVARKNKSARRLAEVLGFKLEGVHPRGLDGVRDSMSYGMIRENCHWIKQYGKERHAHTANAA